MSPPKGIIKEYFSEERIALQREVNRHPILVETLQHFTPSGDTDDDWIARLQEIAAYCLVTLEGNYMPTELDKLCGILTFKLKGMRQSVAVSNTPGGKLQ